MPTCKGCSEPTLVTIRATGLCIECTKQGRGSAVHILAGEEDWVITQAAALALLFDEPNTSWEKRIRCSHSGKEFEIVRGFAIRDDDKTEHICTIVAPGER